MLLRVRLRSIPYALVSIISEFVGVDDYQKEFGNNILHNIHMLPSLSAIRALFDNCENSRVVDYANPVLFCFGGWIDDDGSPYLIEKMLDISENQPVQTRFRLSAMAYHRSLELGYADDSMYDIVSYMPTYGPPVEYSFHGDGFSTTTLHRVFHVMCRSAYAQNGNCANTFRADIIRNSDTFDPPEFTVIHVSRDV